jgi:ABC-type multidrug transport system ATPase subunit
MYARLRGVVNADGVVADLLQGVGLTAHADKVCGSYSGGNKVCGASALVL